MRSNACMRKWCLHVVQTNRVLRQIGAVEHRRRTSDTSSTARHLRARRAGPRRMRSHSGITRVATAKSRAAIDADELAQVIEDLALIELRRAGDAIGEHVRHFERASVVRLWRSLRGRS